MRTINIQRYFPTLFALLLACVLAQAEENPKISTPLVQSSFDQGVASGKTSRQSVLPEEVKKLSPEARAFWEKAKIKPNVPKTLFQQPPSKQLELLKMLSAFEARQREVAEQERDSPKIKDYAKWRMAEDRAELVKPAPADFKPATRRKIKVTLIPQKAMIRKGESFWYRLEMQNIGAETIHLNEDPSFWKVGNENGPLLRCSFCVTPSGGKESCPPFEVIRGPDIPFERNLPASLKDSEKEGYLKRLEEKRARENSRRSHLLVDLRSGEILSARSWAFGDETERLTKILNEENPEPPVSGPWRQLTLISNIFAKPGTYRIKFVYNDPPLPPPAEEEIQKLIKKGVSREWQMKDYHEFADKALGRIESNVVSTEVAP